MGARRLKILAQGEHRAAVGPQVRHHGQDLIGLLTEAEHDPGLGRYLRVPVLELCQQVQGPLVVRPGAGLGIEPGHRLQVVVEDIRYGRAHEPVQGDRLPAAEVGHQDLQQRLRTARPHRLQAGREVSGTAIAQVVPVHRGDDDIAQTHGGNGLGQVVGFGRVGRPGAAVRHVAERAAAGADIPEDHEGGGAVVEALPEIRAIGLLADRGELCLAQESPDPRDLRTRRNLGTNPRGLAQHLGRLFHLDRDARDLVRTPLMGLRGGA